jgi:short subunit dehydrogenase-like uncharacterized protein
VGPVSGRIVVFGATGYTGRLVSEALVGREARPILAGRSGERLADLAAELGGLEFAVADVSDPRSVGDLVDEGDVLVSTVGPFLRWGGVAAEAAISRRAHYLDSTGEPPFVRRVFEEYGPAAEHAGAAMLTAFGYDYVPGNLAGALALHEAGERAARVDIGYFITGRASEGGSGSPLGRVVGGLGGMSGGTAASSIESMARPSFAFRDGRLVAERGAKRVRSFDLEGRSAQAFSVGGSEHFALPRLVPGLREVNAYLGWFGPASRLVQAAGAVGAAIALVPGAGPALAALAARAPGSSGGPSAAARARTGSAIVAIAYDRAGGELARTRLVGVNGYTFTGEILAWGAIRAAEGGLSGAGALGPVDGFGLDQLTAGVASAGLRVQ